MQVFYRIDIFNCQPPVSVSLCRKDGSYDLDRPIRAKLFRSIREARKAIIRIIELHNNFIKIDQFEIKSVEIEK